MANFRPFDISPYKSLSEINRARTAYGAVFIIALLFTAYAVWIPFLYGGISTPLTYLERASNPVEFPLFAVTFTVFYVLLLITYIGVRMGQLNRVALGPAFSLYVGGVLIAVSNNVALTQNMMLLVTAVLLAGLLDGERGLLIFTPIYFITFIGGYASFIGQYPANTLANLLLIIFASVAIVGMMQLFLRFSQASAFQTQVESSRRRLQLAQLTTQITRGLTDVSGSMDLNTVLDRIVHDIREKFPAAYHVQVFMIDEAGRNADLVASTDEVGRQLLERHHSLPVGSLSVIGQVTQRQEPIIAPVGSEDSIHRPNELLPDTRLEVALPISTSAGKIGALDLQSKRADAFDQEDLTALQAIADSIAITINNLQLLEQTQQRLEENQTLVDEMRAAQAEVERLNQELIGSIWRDYLTSTDQNTNFDFDFESEAIQTESQFTESILDAIRRNDIIREERDGQTIVAVPLRVRGEVVGAMEFEVDENLSGEDIDMLNEVSERLGLAAENTRLYTQSQRVAQREALVNEIGAKIQSANSIDATLADAARSLRDGLNARRVAIRLGSPTPDKTGSGEAAP